MKYAKPEPIDPVEEINALQTELLWLGHFENKMRRYIRREERVAAEHKKHGRDYNFGYRNAAAQQLGNATRRAKWVEDEIRRLRYKLRVERFGAVAEPRPIKFFGIDVIGENIKAAA